MSYSVEWEPEARRIMGGISDPGFVSAVIDGADRLAAAPTALSRPLGHAHYGGDQRYGFQVDGRAVTLFFRYSQDEQVLHIMDVSVL